MLFSGEEEDEDDGAMVWTSTIAVDGGGGKEVVVLSNPKPKLISISSISPSSLSFSDTC